MQYKSSTARRRVTPAKPSTRIQHAPDVIRFGTLVWIVARKSDDKDAKRCLADQSAHTAEEAIRQGAKILGSSEFITPGSDPYWLRAVAEQARKHGAIIVAATTDRLIRSYNYDQHHQDWLPNQAELDYLMRVVDGVPLATIDHPDATNGEQRSFQSKRGQERTGRKGGRPVKKVAGIKKQRRVLLQPQAIQLRREKLSLKEISQLLDVKRSTVQDWLKNQT